MTFRISEASLKAQIRQISPPSIPGKNLNAVEQVLLRMKQEAFINQSMVVKLRHLVISLFSMANGPAKFNADEILRTGGILNHDLRDFLDLERPYNPELLIDENYTASPLVQEILEGAKILSKAERPETQEGQIASTQFILQALINHFSKGRSKEYGEYQIIEAITTKKLASMD